MLKPKVLTLGTGTCRIDPLRAESSMCVIDKELTFLFDCGIGVPRRLVEAGGFENCRSLHIHLSHEHLDHIGGVPSLLQSLTYPDDPKFLQVEEVVIHCSEQVELILKNVLDLFGVYQSDLLGYYPEKNRKLRFEIFDNDSDSEYSVRNILVKSVYLPSAFNHGVKFEIYSVRYAITGDATEFNEKLIQFCSEADRVLFDFGHLTNVKDQNGFRYSLENVVRLLTECQTGKFYASHVYLRTFEESKIALSFDERISESVKLVSEVLGLVRNFKGDLILAEDLMEI